jgi:hypothetical protein
MIRLRVFWLSGKYSKSEFTATSWYVDTVHNHLVIQEQDGSISYVERSNIRYFIVDAARGEE